MFFMMMCVIIRSFVVDWEMIIVDIYFLVKTFGLIGTLFLN